jgi:hypothetical protein
MKLLILASMVALAPSNASAKTDPTYPPAWGQYVTQPERQVVPRAAHVRVSHRRRPTRSPPIEARAAASPVEQQLRADIAALRREIAGIRAEVGRPPDEKPLIFQMATLFPSLGAQKTPPEGVGLPNLDLGGYPSAPTEPPSTPLSSRSSGIESVDEVRAARVYLIQTAVPGWTMTRLTPEVSIGRLHPEFVIKLQEAIQKARQAGLNRAGVFSAYRPPIFGIGGFSDKFNSLHSYGLAVDVTGIGTAGSKEAHLWENIVRAVGLFLPYGASNRAEFNHVQLIPDKVAPEGLHKTITASAPKDLRNMWLASGVQKGIPDREPINSARLLPENVWP